MADLKISQLPVFTSAVPATDAFAVVSGGTTKQITTNQILGSSGVATLASATITGAATVGTTLGVTGVSTFAAGTALLPALTTTGDTNTGIYYPAADTVAVTTGGTERWRVDSSGNVGIGNTPTAGWRAGARALQIGSNKYVSLHEQAAGGTNLCFAAYESAANVFSYTTGDATSRYVQLSGAHEWYSAALGTINTVITFGDPKMTLTAAGDLLVGQTNASADALGGIWLKNAANSNGSAVVINHRVAVLTGSTYADFNFNGGTIGSITQSGTTAVLYNTTSDYRLKESVAPLSGGLARVNALKPSVYNWKSDGSTGEGFLAHELAEVVPAAVSGEKDAVNADGSIKSQGIDMSRIVPILVAAIQELTAEVNALKNA